MRSLAVAGAEGFEETVLGTEDVLLEGLFELRKTLLGQSCDDGFVLFLLLIEAGGEAGQGWALGGVDAGDLDVAVEALVEVAEFF